MVSLLTTPGIAVWLRFRRDEVLLTLSAISFQYLFDPENFDRQCAINAMEHLMRDLRNIRQRRRVFFTSASTAKRYFDKVQRLLAYLQKCIGLARCLKDARSQWTSDFTLRNTSAAHPCLSAGDDLWSAFMRPGASSSYTAGVPIPMDTFLARIEGPSLRRKNTEVFALPPSTWAIAYDWSEEYRAFIQKIANVSQ